MDGREEISWLGRTFSFSLSVMGRGGGEVGSTTGRANVREARREDKERKERRATELLTPPRTKGDSGRRRAQGRRRPRRLADAAKSDLSRVIICCARAGERSGTSYKADHFVQNSHVRGRQLPAAYLVRLPACLPCRLLSRWPGYLHACLPGRLLACLSASLCVCESGSGGEGASVTA